MEHLANRIKRKKRKTRKSLNEMRKRLYGNSDACSSLISASNFNDSRSNRQYANIERKNNNITTNRLTLGLFHRAVRSETITRPALLEIRKQTAPDVNHIPKKNIPNSQVHNSSQPLGTGVDDVKKSCNSRSNNISSISNKHKIMEVLSNSTSSSENIICNFPKSPALFSPDKLHIPVTPTFEESQSPKDLPTSPLESPLSADDHQLYEDFIKSMPKYLIEKTPALIKDDVMQQTKAFLHNLYLEGCRRETEDNILHCIKNNLKEAYPSFNSFKNNFSPKRVYEEDPMVYIKSRYDKQLVRSWEDHRSVSSSTSNSPMALTNTSVASHSFIHDTPEYVYFPHKLNH